MIRARYLVVVSVRVSFKVNLRLKVRVTVKIRIQIWEIQFVIIEETNDHWFSLLPVHHSCFQTP